MKLFLPDTVEKCHYLLQAARLCQLYDQAESARRLFRRSQDLLADSPLARRSNTDKQQLRKQFLMLCANTYDQGYVNNIHDTASLSEQVI